MKKLAIYIIILGFIPSLFEEFSPRGFPQYVELVGTARYFDSFVFQHIIYKILTAPLLFPGFAFLVLALLFMKNLFKVAWIYSLILLVLSITPLLLMPLLSSVVVGYECFSIQDLTSCLIFKLSSIPKTIYGLVAVASLAFGFLVGRSQVRKKSEVVQ